MAVIDWNMILNNVTGPGGIIVVLAGSAAAWFKLRKVDPSLEEQTTVAEEVASPPEEQRSRENTHELIGIMAGMREDLLHERKRRHELTTEFSTQFAELHKKYDRSYRVEGILSGWIIDLRGNWSIYRLSEEAPPPPVLPKEGESDGNATSG